MVRDEELRRELLARVEEEQRVRHLLLERYGWNYRRPEARADLEHMAAVDERNTAWLAQVVRERGWPGHGLVGEDGAHAAWLIAQHTPDLQFQRDCLELVRAAVAEGDASRTDLAHLIDGVAVLDGEPQTYGTQITLAGFQMGS